MLRRLRWIAPTFSRVLLNPNLRIPPIKYRRFASTSIPLASPPSPHLNGSAPASLTPPDLENPTSQQGAEEQMISLDFTFKEEPLGLTAEQGHGFLDVGFGDILGSPSQSYRVVRKLGFGMYSSVWLARDLKQDRYVAIKALTGHATKLLSEGYLQELRVIQRISSEPLSPVHANATHCLSLLFSFIHPAKDQDGDHLCIVTDIMGGSVKSLLRASPTSSLPVPLAKRVFRHLLLGLAHMHKCGVVHTDLKADNIMMDLGPMSTQDIENSIKIDPLRRYPPEPTWGFKTVEVALSQPVSSPSLVDALSRSFIIVDFGSAQFCDHQVVDHITPDSLRAPETILKGPWNEKVDIWIFGCLIFEFLTGRTLFTLKTKLKLRQEVSHLFQMISMTRELFTPTQLRQSRAALEFFDPKTGLLKEWPYAHKTTYQKMMSTYKTVGEADMDGAAGLMSKCLRLRPEDRASAEELLKDPWLAEV